MRGRTTQNPFIEPCASEPRTTGGQTGGGTLGFSKMTVPGQGSSRLSCYWPKAQHVGGSGAEPLRSTANHAFTLIEMLISLTIVSAIVTMVYGSYAATSRSLDVYSDRMACTERAHLALRMMARQIRCAYMPPVATQATQDEPSRRSVPAESAVAFRAGPQGLRGDFLTLTTTGGFGLGLDGPVGISRVAYRYDGPRRTLLISCEPDADSAGRAADPGLWRPLLGSVTSLELAFFDGRQWQPTWDSSKAGRLPQAVKIVLAVADEKGREHHFATAVPVICRAAAQDKQVTTPVKRP